MVQYAEQRDSPCVNKGCSTHVFLLVHKGQCGAAHSCSRDWSVWGCRIGNRKSKWRKDTNPFIHLSTLTERSYKAAFFHGSVSLSSWTRNQNWLPDQEHRARRNAPLAISHILSAIMRPTPVRPVQLTDSRMSPGVFSSFARPFNTSQPVLTVVSCRRDAARSEPERRTSKVGVSMICPVSSATTAHVQKAY